MVRSVSRDIPGRLTWRLPTFTGTDTQPRVAELPTKASTGPATASVANDESIGSTT
jgi:hypothetical protein